MEVLTGIDETGTGFVGKRNLRRGKAKNGMLRINFDLGCGVTNPTANKYASWRHCVAYGRLAEMLKNIKPGLLVKFTGWVSTEAELDEYYNPKIGKNNEPVLRETTVLRTAEILHYQKLQPELVNV